jgi:N-acetylneuraminic acid mutarotase
MKKILFFFFLLSQIFAQNWKTLKPENECVNRHENSFVAVGDELIIVGGRGIKPVESFDLKTNKWTKYINTPIEMHHFQAFAFQNELWVIGAFTGGYPHEKPIPNAYIFNPKKNEWRVGPEIPENRRRGAAAALVFKNKIYLINGIIDGHWDGHVAWFDEYDPKTNQWKTLPDSPHARDHVQAVVIDNKFYVAGGRKSHAKIKEVLTLTTREVDVFDFKTNSWTTLPENLNLPTQRAGASCVVVDKKMIVIGGESGSQVAAHSEAEVLDTKLMKWEKLPNLNQGRHGTGATIYKKKIYTAGGSGNRGGGPELNSIEVYSPN